MPKGLRGFQDKRIAIEAGKKSRRGKSGKTLEWETWGKEITTIGITRAKEILNESPNEKFWERFMQILEYFKPKMMRTEISGTDEEGLKINVTLKNVDG